MMCPRVIRFINTATVAFMLLTTCASAWAGASAEHPRAVLNAKEVSWMRKGVKSNAEFSRVYLDAKASVDKGIEAGVVVPVPKDAGGGYTHEQHKKNYKHIYETGLLYQVTKDRRYLAYARDILLAYADMYPSLGDHPKKKEQSPGRLFWQSLNEAVWLVYSIQGYDAIISGLNAEQRQKIEQGVLLPMAKFLSDESPQTFNKIHNHGTWAVAAVGMTGYVLGRQDMVAKAIYGLDKSGRYGFIKQLDMLFSPDGYYTEGPYYQRYALMPFILFAKAIHYNDPERNIFQYRGEILKKAVYSTIQLSYGNYFFPINDALKDKGLDTAELVLAVSIMYGINQDPALLSIAQSQGTVSFSGDGAKLAKALAKALKKESLRPFPFVSMQMKDGYDGSQGALSILRTDSAKGHLALVAKNTSQGMGHGHFDKLNWLLYDNGREIVSDYGAARFLNVESKYGGHYLPENKTWAKQTIAHNTLVVDETSHFKGKTKTGNKWHPESLIFDVSDNVKIVSAKMDNAYSGVSFTRTMAIVTEADQPLIIDVLRVSADRSHQYDLPLYYQGHIVNTNLNVEQAKTLSPLGKNNGYQHLWLRSTGSTNKDFSQVTWLNGNRFYSVSSPLTASGNAEVLFVQLGANDPNFNLRPEQGMITRLKKAKDHSFVSIIEPHGEYNGAKEYTRGNYSRIKHIELSREGQYDYVALTLNVDGEGKAHKTIGLALSYDRDKERSHVLQHQGTSVEWQGFYALVEEEK